MRATDRQKFVQLANRRVPAAVKQMELIGNLANRSNYSFTDEDAKAIVKTLKAAVAECEARFAGRETKADGFGLE